MLQFLGREGLLSNEKYEQLADLEELDPDTLKDVIVSSEFGQGISFLLRTLRSLRHTLQSLLEDLTQSGGSSAASQVAAIPRRIIASKCDSSGRI